MSRRSNAIAASRNFRHKSGLRMADGVAPAYKMSAEELQSHLLLRGRGGFTPGKRKDQQKGGGNSRRYALA